MSNFHDVPVKDITIGERFRKDYGDLTALKASIESFTDVTDTGLLEPILLDRDNKLLAGGRRLQAFIELNRARIPAQYLDEVDELRSREIELEENLQRKDLTWAESDLLIKEINDLKQAKYAGLMKPANLATSSIPEAEKQERLADPDYTPRLVPAWTMNDTAALVGESRHTISRHIDMATCLTIIPELADEESRQQAWKKVDRRIEEIERELEFRRRKSLGQLASSQILHGDCVELLKQIPDYSIDLIITDPPYGVLEAGGIHRYESGVHFDDDPVLAMATIKAAARELRRVAKPDAHLYCFFGIKMLDETRKIFEEVGFNLDPIPLIWIKNYASVVDWDHRYANYYEPIFFLTSNNPRRLCGGGKKLSNIFTYDSPPISNRSNIAEKPVDLIKNLILNSTNPNDIVLDCFAGSGVTAVAAKITGRQFIVMEKDEGLWKSINNRVASITEALETTESSS